MAKVFVINGRGYPQGGVYFKSREKGTGKAHGSGYGCSSCLGEAGRLEARLTDILRWWIVIMRKTDSVLCRSC
jgi:hypothetical protein